MADLTVDQFRDRISDTRATCPICQHRDHSLVAHIKEKHGLTFGQFRQKYDNPLVSPIVSEMIRVMGRSPKQTEKFEEFLPAFEAKDSASLFKELKRIMSIKTKPTTHPNLVPDAIPAFFFDESALRPLVYGIAKTKNTYLEGPTGCGKTELIFQVHNRLGLPLKRVNMNGDVTVSNFVGTRQVDPTQGTYFKYGNLPLAMRGGYTLLIDEIDYMPPQIAAVLNSVLESKRSLYIPETDETIVAEPGFNVIASANTGGKGDSAGVYTGTEVLNTALLDRFGIKITMGYLPMGDETKMIQDRFPGKDIAMVQKVVVAANEIRKSFLNGAIPVTVSTRKVIDIFESEEILGLTESVKCAILNWMDTDNQIIVTQILDKAGIKIDTGKKK